MKHIAAFALLATAAVAASAQSNVTLFGVVDVAARHVKNGDNTLRSLSGNGLNSSRLGFRGVEDLGGGLKAGFWLEHGFNVDTGTQSDAARFWNRRSTVSLSGGFGELRLGRDFTPTYTGFADYDVFGTNGVADAGKFNSVLGTNADTATRSDNEVSYFTPGNLGGFRAQVSFAPSEKVAGKKYMGGRVAYGAGPLDVSLAYGQTTVTPSAGEDKYKFVVLGGSYDFGVAKLTGYVSQAEFANLEMQVANIGVQVPLGQGILRASYIRADASGRTAAGANTENNDANQIALGYVYNLSKRTALYTTVARVNNKAGATFVVSGGPALPSPNNGKDSTGVDFGLRHSF
ncbi:porin [Pseudaquabacterium terrae]|nr:porin [Aquabacterium terrae]